MCRTKQKIIRPEVEEIYRRVVCFVDMDGKGGVFCISTTSSDSYSIRVLLLSAEFVIDWHLLLIGEYTYIKILKCSVLIYHIFSDTVIFKVNFRMKYTSLRRFRLSYEGILIIPRNFEFPAL